MTRNDFYPVSLELTLHIIIQHEGNKDILISEACDSKFIFSIKNFYSEGV